MESNTIYIYVLDFGSRNIYEITTTAEVIHDIVHSDSPGESWYDFFNEYGLDHDDIEYMTSKTKLDLEEINKI